MADGKSSRGRDGSWERVARLEDLAPGDVRPVEVRGRRVALGATARGPFAVDDACPHEGGPLAAGCVEDGVLSCPMHGWRFDVASGACIDRPEHRVAVHETRIRGGAVELRTAAPAAADGDGAERLSKVERWKRAKHGLDVWPDVVRHASTGTRQSDIDRADLERMKWYGYFHRSQHDRDRYMCRVRVPGCELSAQQARLVAHLARGDGHGLVDVTTRGNLQIQGLRIEALPRVREALEAAGLSARQSGHDNVRNVMSDPLSGLDPEEIVDTRSLARAIQAIVLADRDLADLPRKVNVQLVGRPDLTPHAWTQDLCLYALRRDDGMPAFGVMVGGNQGLRPRRAERLAVRLAVAEAVPFVIATLRLFRELGDRHDRQHVRLGSLLERLGAQRFVDEVALRMPVAPERLDAPPAAPETREQRLVGWIGERGADRHAAGIGVELGRLGWDQLEGLALLADRHGDGTLRTTPEQGVVLPGVSAAERVEVEAALARLGLSVEPDLVSRNVVACTGRQYCNIAVTETKGHAYGLMEELRRRRVLPHGVRIQMSGCPSSCALSHTAEIGLKGTKVRRRMRSVDAFDVYVGGGVAGEPRLGILHEKGVPVDELPDRLERLIREYQRKRRASESFSDFWGRRLVGHQALRAEGEVATWVCGRCEHSHRGEDPPRLCPSCAAPRGSFAPAPSEPPEERPAAEAPRDEHDGKVRDIRTGRRRGSSTRLLIVGGGIAGHTAAETARAIDPDAEITLITDERHSFYNRLNLTRYLAEDIERSALFDYGPDFYGANDVRVLTRSRAVGLDRLRRAVRLGDGHEVAFDRCVLAHGSSARVPGFFVHGLENAFLLRTLADVDAILDRIRADARIAVVGGGVLGLEAAYGIHRRGASVCVFEQEERPMPRQLDRRGGELLAALVRERGLELALGTRVERIVGDGRVSGLELAEGRVEPFDTVVVTAGIRPNVGWVSRAGIECRRGVVVDDRLQSSVEGIFAAGDVAEWRGRVVGLWMNAVEQARVAAANAVGRTTLFGGWVEEVSLKCLGIPVIAVGRSDEDGGAITSSARLDEVERSYRRVVYGDGLPIGGVLVGTASGAAELRRLVAGGRELERLRARVDPAGVVAV